MNLPVAQLPEGFYFNGPELVRDNITTPAQLLFITNIRQ